MKKISIILDYFVTGMGFGAISYILILTFVDPGAVSTPTMTISVLGISGLIGLLTMIFKTGLPLIIAVIIHFVGTFIAFIIMAMLNHWEIGETSLGIFLLIYLIIWIILIVEQKRNIKQLNERIRARRATEKNK